MKTINYIIFLTLLPFMQSCAQDTNKEIVKMEKSSNPTGKRYDKNPYYAVQIFSSNCIFDLRLNDMMVFKYMDTEGGLSTLVPLNDNILNSGRQEITAQIMPIHGEAQLGKYATFKIEVRLYKDVDDPILKYEPILQYELKVPEEGMPGTIFKEVFTAQVPYELKAWKNSKDLTKDKHIEDEVLKFYREYQKLIENKNLTSLFKIKQLRDIEIANAFYLTGAQVQERVDSFVEIINEPDAVIQPLDSARLVFYANGRVVNLEMPDGDSALRLIIETKEDEQAEGVTVEGDEIITLSMMLHKPKGSDKLEVIR